MRDTLCLFIRVSLQALISLQSSISRELPLLIYGAMAIIGGALVFVLPETRDQPMRQTVQEGEKFIRENMCNFGACKRCTFFG